MSFRDLLTLSGKDKSLAKALKESKVFQYSPSMRQYISEKAVDGRKGFQGFELMRPTDDRETWLVITRWDTEEDFLAWVQSPDFAEGHRSAMEAANEHPEPLPLTAELWSYIVELQADGSTD